MTSVTRSVFDQLARFDNGDCVSIYLPIGHGADQRCAATRLRGLIGAAQAALDRRGSGGAEDLLAGPNAAAERASFGHVGTLAYFCAPGLSLELPLDAVVEALVTVGPRFEVSPLLAAMDTGSGGHVLTVGARNVRLYRIDADSLHECAVPDLAHSVDDSLWYERVERHVGSHSGQPVGSGHFTTIGHGSGAQRESRKERLERYFHHVDHAVLDYLGADRVGTLFVAGTTPEVARFTGLTRHPHTVAVNVGSSARLSLRELYERVGATRDDGEALAVGLSRRFAEVHGTGLGACDLDEVIAAAAAGRVETLLLGGPDPVWRLGETDEGRAPAGERVDLVNLAVTEAWRHGAGVHLAPPELLPADASVAAIFRY